MPRSGHFQWSAVATDEIIPSGKIVDEASHMRFLFPDREISMTTPSNIGESVRSARKGMGLRQDELAAAAGVGLRFLVELERGKATVQLGKVLLVLAAVGLDVRVVPRQAPHDQPPPS